MSAKGTPTPLPATSWLLPKEGRRREEEEERGLCSPPVLFTTEATR